MAKRKHDDSASDPQQPDATTTDRSESMQPSATASSSVLETHISTSVAPSQILEPSQSSGAVDAAPQQPQAITSQAYNGPVKRKKVIDHQAAMASVLNAEISLMKNEVSTLEAQNAAIKAENAELDARNDKFESENIDLKALNDSLKIRNSYLEAQRNKLKEQNIKLQAQYDKLDDDHHNIDAVKNGRKSLHGNVEVQRDKLKAQNTKLHNKYATLQAEYSDLEGQHHELRIQFSSMKKHIRKLQDVALFEQDDHGDYTRAILKKMQEFAYEVQQGLGIYATSKKSLPGYLLDTYENANELSDFLYKTVGPHRPPKRSGAAVLSAKTDLMDDSSGSDYPGDIDDTDDSDGTDDTDDTCDSDDSIDSSDTGDSGSCSDSGGSSI
ncbi:AP-1-like transcription factor YAP6 [Lasiodiplodia hormozganensis]|uniref:AP-1-like transcription factor YAP6 n=1 Tax=Lasiodiplodia hormozganensis TaxID=869390 RepID=A0AA39W401_9PEZI|nr:AP-1-like transcription factor YAP6 [Lasiodiplodia hormozganensis]